MGFAGRTLRSSGTGNGIAALPWMGRAASRLTVPVELDQLREVPFGDPAPGIVPRRRTIEVRGRRGCRPVAVIGAILAAQRSSMCRRLRRPLSVGNKLRGQHDR